MNIVGQNSIMSGKRVFELVDRHGMPIMVINAALRERGVGFDVPEFIEAARNAGWKNRTIRTTLLDDSSIPQEARDQVNQLLP